jgi:hypothetical protein
LKNGDCTCQNKELHQRVKKEKTLQTNKLFDYRLTFIEVVRKKNDTKPFLYKEKITLNQNSYMQVEMQEQLTNGNNAYLMHVWYSYTNRV